jgi:hypothetical protein
MFFQFEADFVDNLQCIPMQVRYNLDTCGIKLKLNEWNQLNAEEKSLLVNQNCSTEAAINAYRSSLQQMVFTHTGQNPKDLPIDDNPPWLDVNNIPEPVQSKLAQFGVKVTVEQWQKLAPLERFALIKLSRSSHENANFLPALKEFNLTV